VEALFFRIVNTTRDSKGHKGKGSFYHILCEISNAQVSLWGKTFEHRGKEEMEEEDNLVNG
jgi:hypothetical protein